MFILVTGGSGSGKSEYAEQRICGLHREDTPLLYLATMQPYGEEGARRVAKHKAQRSGRGFETLEWYQGLEHAPIPADSSVLLECMSNLAANEMFSAQVDEQQLETHTQQCYARILAGVAHVKEHCENLVIVTNEVFSDTLAYDVYTIAYIRLLGHINAVLAARADEVVEVVYGIPVRVK